MFKEALGNVLLWHIGNARDEMLFHKDAIETWRARPLEEVRLDIRYEGVDIGLVCQTALLLNFQTLRKFQLNISTEDWEARQPECWELLFFTLASCKRLEELVLDARAGYWGVNYFNLAVLDFSPTSIGVFEKLEQLWLLGCSLPPATLKGLLKVKHLVLHDWMDAEEGIFREPNNELQSSIKIVGWRAIHASSCLCEKEMVEARQIDHAVVRQVLKRTRPKHFFAHNIGMEIDRQFLRALKDEFPQLLVTLRKW
ncbi:hypothetical protein KFL_000040600 [Klebsormidium nitens]|uniref:Uncharacterized protein n=1 Tax=Klebsormidium nitens TaxID=105231 RepID=A0A1Y1HHC5_KLENI|nr:hypothetical protein KFL_000040600 [Klebsormidium nitens]|eukprot:GAQ77860.1 hypothetical protein KFL_000040600 [Klebsormidium nitens]